VIDCSELVRGKEGVESYSRAELSSLRARPGSNTVADVLPDAVYEHPASRLTPEERRHAAPTTATRTLLSEAQRLQRSLGNRAAAQLIPPILARQSGSPASSASGSRLIGLKRRLAWSDFVVLRSRNDPELRGNLAGIFLSTSARVGGAAVAPASFTGQNGKFTLRDDVAVEPIFKGFQAPEVGSLSNTESQLLLDHEQVHYDLQALNARDEFIEIMALKAQTFSTAAEGVIAVKDIIGRFDRLGNKIQSRFDDVSETGHLAWERPMMGPVRKPLAESRWETFVTLARETPRQPEVTAPDGSPYKVPLERILADKGISL